MAQVSTIAVIGAGTMGRGIAHVAALGGYRTILEDLLPNALRKAESEIRSNLDKAVELGKVSTSDAEAAFVRLEYAGGVEEAAREADLVIEAVPEEMESKIEIFTLLDKICRPGTILASNTSSLSITEIASVTYRGKKCVGMHFFNACAQDEPAGSRSCARDRRRHARNRRRCRQAHGQGSGNNQGVSRFITSRIDAMIGRCRWLRQTLRHRHPAAFPAIC